MTITMFILSKVDDVKYTFIYKALNSFDEDRLLEKRGKRIVFNLVVQETLQILKNVAILV